MIMNEFVVMEAVLKYLTKNGYEIRGYKGPKRHGADIEARKNNWDFIIEAKGNPSPRGGSQREVYFLQALGQIVTRMTRLKAARYGLAFPESYKELLLRRVPWKACSRLSLYFFLVDESGGVEVLDYRDVRKSQSDQSSS
jgi:hypothetical protein